MVTPGFGARKGRPRGTRLRYNPSPMRAPLDNESIAFRRLRGWLVQRRFSQLELRLRIELAVLSLMLGAFVFWQVRIPLDGIRFAAGATGVLAALGFGCAALALVTSGLVGARHWYRLRVGPGGPSWLSLPATPGALTRHLAWESAFVAGWMAIPAAGFWIAAFGLVPFLWWIALAIPFAAVLVLAARAGAAAADRITLWQSPPSSRGATAVERALGGTARRVRGGRLPAARWMRQPTWLAIARKDLRLSLRVPALGRSLVIALLFWALSIAAWRMPATPPAHSLGYLSAFVLALAGSGVFGEWLVSLAGSDPFATIRALPVGVASLWSARFAFAVAGALLLVLGHALSARDVSPHALRLFLAWIGIATLAIAALAVNYGVTLFPRADLAQRMLGLSLGLAVAGSLMIPLMGWLVLLSAVIHSTRRLARWSRLEEI